MKILSNFDRVVTEVLADKVRSKLSFKVRNNIITKPKLRGLLFYSLFGEGLTWFFYFDYRAISILTVFATKSGLS